MHMHIHTVEGGKRLQSELYKPGEYLKAWA